MSPSFILYALYMFSNEKGNVAKKYALKFIFDSIFFSSDTFDNIYSNNTDAVHLVVNCLM